MKSRWLFVAAAGIPCAVLVLFCGVAIHEWWLISSNQIAVIPRPERGTTGSVANLPASAVLPLVFGSGLLAGMFGYALVRRSGKVLVGAYLIIGLIFGSAYVRHML